MKTTDNTDITITIIKVSDRGAYLITDGTKQAWTRPSSRRADGTWTPSAYKALQESETPYVAPEEQARIDKEKKEAREKAREEESIRRQKSVFLVLQPKSIVADMVKCYKVATGRKVQSPYKHYALISEYIYIPKSQVKLTKTDGKYVLEMPTWLYEANIGTYSLIGKLIAE